MRTHAPPTGSPKAGASERKTGQKMFQNVAKRAFQFAPIDQRVVGARQPPAGTRTVMGALGKHCGAVWRGSTRDQTTLDPFVGRFFATFCTPHWQPLAHSTLWSDGRPAYSLAASDRPQGPLRTCWAPWVLVLKHFPMLPSGEMLGPQQIVSTTERFETKHQHLGYPGTPGWPLVTVVCVPEALTRSYPPAKRLGSHDVQYL